MKKMLRPAHEDNIIRIAATANWTAGQFIAVGAIGVGCVQDTVVTGQLVAVMCGGQHRVVKATGTAWVIGDQLYFHVANNNFTTVSAGAIKAGYAISIQASGDTTGDIKLTAPTT